METTIGGKDKKQLFKELKERKIVVSDLAKRIMDSEDFTTSKKPEQIQLIRLTAGDLGFKEMAKIDEIYKKAEELGLELCPAETGPNLRINYEDQPLDDLFRIAMKPVSIRNCSSVVFELARRNVDPWLSVGSDFGVLWFSDAWFVFRFRKLDKKF